MKRFRGGLVIKAHRLWYHTTLGSRVIKKKRRLRHLPFRVARDLDRLVVPLVDHAVLVNPEDGRVGRVDESLQLLGDRSLLKGDGCLLDFDLDSGFRVWGVRFGV